MKTLSRCHAVIDPQLYHVCALPYITEQIRPNLSSMRLEIKLDCQLQLPGGINGSGQRKCRGRQSSEQGYVPGHRVRGETAILVHIYKREVTSTGSQARIGAVPNVKALEDQAKPGCFAGANSPRYSCVGLKNGRSPETIARHCGFFRIQHPPFDISGGRLGLSQHTSRKH